MNMPAQKYGQINQAFYSFINEEVLPILNKQVMLNTPITPAQFWQDLERLITTFAPRNRRLLQTRHKLQTEINAWHQQHPNFCSEEYRQFLTEINYLVPTTSGIAKQITTENVDPEISKLAGPQLVVPVTNARFALNAANARWGSLYDALYGTNAMDAKCEYIDELSSKPNEQESTQHQRVIHYAKGFLDRHFPLLDGSHKDVSEYIVYASRLTVFFKNKKTSGLQSPDQFVAFCGERSKPSSILLKNNGLHLELVIDCTGNIGRQDPAGIQDIQLESALTSIIDFEDSVSTVDAQDKIHAYRNWLGLMRGDLQASFTKYGQVHTRKLRSDIDFNGKNGEQYKLPGRALLLCRNVGHLMETELMKDEQGGFAPEGIVDAVVTSLIAMIDLNKSTGMRNSRTGSIYIVKPKMHGPDEVAFTRDLFTAVENMLGLPMNTIKLGIMDEERRTSVNLAASIDQASERVVFINTGFLDRTGDEIHTSMHAGSFLPKNQIKKHPWIYAYESRNVNTGISKGLVGKAQIGKGMWAMPKEMSQMMQQKIAHIESGASTAWVPSPTAATLHAMHYHQCDVTRVQAHLTRKSFSTTPDAQQLDALLTIPLQSMAESHNNLSQAEVVTELENNIQGILGYVSRWVKLGIGCSTVPDIQNVGLMEDRATLRISSQHIANWLLHGLCSIEQINAIMESMAVIVDEQNRDTPNYIPMTNDLSQDFAYTAARKLILEGAKQPNGYTEPLLHHFRLLEKQRCG